MACSKLLRGALLKVLIAGHCVAFRHLLTSVLHVPCNAG